MAISIGEEIRDDSAALYRFIDSICAPCEGRQGAYIEPSDRFFLYITDLGEKTKAYLADFPSHIPADASLQRVYRQKLTILRGCWSELHNFVKPSIDADTLNVPFPLLAVLYSKLNTVPQFADVSFAVYHLHEVNYRQIRASWIRELTGKLVSHIPAAVAFPKSLGLIGIPFSQSSSVFLNALIPHEIGHFVYQELDKWSELKLHASAELATVCGPTASGLSTEDVAWALDRIASWTQEIFCDLFAVWMVGPAYVFAFIEIFDLMRLSYPGPAATTDELEFSLSHPADAIRLRQQIALLDKLGWWKEVKLFKTHYVRVLDHVSGLTPSALTFPLPFVFPLADKALQTFLNILPRIIFLVETAVGPLDPCVADFQRFNGQVEEALHRGIVPSTILLGGERYHPSPTTILNSAYKLGLESLDELIDKIHDQDNTSVAVRSKWLKRLELWAMKAFEDHIILSTGGN